MILVYIVVTVILLLLIVAALLPKTYLIEKTAIIKRPLNEVMSKVGDLHYYSQWNPWQQSDFTVKNTITGDPLTPGHRYAWEGKKVGVGSLTLQSIDNRYIHFELEFIKPWKSKAKDNWLFESWGDGSETKVTWTNSGSLPWPIARLLGPMISKNLNYQFDKGLANLKQMAES